MIIGVPKEVKDHESRVGITPAGVKALVDAGHKVLVETNAGRLSSFPDDEYQAVGAEIVGEAGNVWGNADMVVKVKEPVEKEYAYFREGLVLFTYLHLAPIRGLTDALLSKKVTGIAYETVKDAAGTLPLLTPMSEVAGRLSVQIGAAYLEKEHIADSEAPDVPADKGGPPLTDKVLQRAVQLHRGLLALKRVLAESGG